MIAGALAGSLGAWGGFDYARIVTRIDVDWFFDRPRVQAICDRATIVMLTKAGKIVRDKVRQGIKRRGIARTRELTSARGRARVADEIRTRPASPEGTPPFTHTGFFRQWIAYQYDPRSRSVVIGALRSHWLYDLHEFGGRHPRPQTNGGRGGQYPRRPAFELGFQRALPFLRVYTPEVFANNVRVNGASPVF
jgi:hypothetical protein